MADQKREDVQTQATQTHTSGRGSERDPRDTEHPTGAKQAAENAANESPS